MSKLIIGISGKKRRGKDTAGMYLSSLLGAENAKTMYWATKMKIAAAEMLGLPPYHFFTDAHKDHEYEIAAGIFITGREFLQKFGTDCFRDLFHENFWVFQVMGDIMSKKEGIILIPDTRFPNEYEAIKDQGGYVIRIERTMPPDPGDDHESETALDGYDFDLVVDNNGDLLGPNFTDPLKQFVENYCR
jgi:hypothetical protein